MKQRESQGTSQRQASLGHANLDRTSKDHHNYKPAYCLWLAPSLSFFCDHASVIIHQQQLASPARCIMVVATSLYKAQE